MFNDRTTLASPDLGCNGLGEGGGRALAETPRLNTAVMPLDLGFNDLEGGGRAQAEKLRLNTTVTSLDLGFCGLGGRALVEAAPQHRVTNCASTPCHALCLKTVSRRSTLPQIT